jgi:hypothetical protein
VADKQVETNERGVSHTNVGGKRFVSRVGELLPFNTLCAVKPRNEIIRIRYKLMYSGKYWAYKLSYSSLYK